MLKGENAGYRMEDKDYKEYTCKFRPHNQDKIICNMCREHDENLFASDPFERWSLIRMKVIFSGAFYNMHYNFNTHFC